MTGKPVAVVVVWLLALLLVALPVEAYLDPGTGSYVFQMVAAVVVSVGFMVKTYWRQLRAFLARRGKPGPPHEG
jgi:ABC-type Na+ efflux pump permease subunit